MQESYQKRRLVAISDEVGGLTVTTDLILACRGWSIMSKKL